MRAEAMEVELYIHGCECGKQGVLISRLRNHFKRTEAVLTVLNSKYDDDARATHWGLLGQLKKAGTNEPVLLVDGIAHLAKEYHV